ncbi:PQQ-binding-like beta-propeller repeat protein [Candidatus Uabimicrobium sp. HlEnr_7]|uniref:serine/threonine-protein kinase n=1 Tax=Candidatus Uabimicrobium helgolandensis TaxID=3095367 RepID=UPI00355682F9
MQIGNYQILSELGQGNMGRVFLAEDVKNNRKVALKVMLEEQNKLQQKRFLREALAMSKLSHPNIIKIYDISKEEGSYYFTMRYIEGETLSSLIKNKRLTTSKIVDITTKIAHAIHYAHKNNVLHRDLKPSNIMINKNGEPIIMDFGLARQIRDRSRLSQTGDILGTPAYMSPEQANGSKSVDQQSDVYSLGICLYEMLTGRVPFSGTKWQILAQLMNDKPLPLREHNSQIPETLEIICLKALEKRKKLRFVNALLLAEELERFATGKASQIKKRVGATFILWLERYHLPVMGALVIFLGMICSVLLYEQYFSKAQQICKISFEDPPFSENVASQVTSLQIQGQVNEGHFLRKVFIQGSEHLLKENHKFTAKIPLQYGKNVIDIVTLSNSGNWNERSWNVTRTTPKKQVLFLGGNHRNRFVKQETLSDQLREKWHFESEEIIGGSAIVCSNMVYFGSDDYFYAIDVENGTEIWKFKANDEIRATPAIKNGFVYFAAEDMFYCLDMYCGRKQWNFFTDERSWSSPAIDENTVYVGCNDGKLFAFDAIDGHQRWRFRINDRDRGRGGGRGRGRHHRNHFSAAPALYQNTVIATNWNGKVYCLRKSNKQLVWSFDTKQKIETSPVIVNDAVYFGSNNRKVYALNAKNGNVKWSFGVGGSVDSTPCIQDEVIYFGCDDYHIYAVDIKASLIKWKTKIESEIFSSPVIVGNRLYCCDYAGFLYLVNVETGDIVVRKKFNGKTYSTPFIDKNNIYFASENILYALAAYK